MKRLCGFSAQVTVLPKAVKNQKDLTGAMMKKEGSSVS
jgi:hypothetical protein